MQLTSLKLVVSKIISNIPLNTFTLKGWTHKSWQISWLEFLEEQESKMDSRETSFQLVNHMCISLPGASQNFLQLLIDRTIIETTVIAVSLSKQQHFYFHYSTSGCFSSPCTKMTFFASSFYLGLWDSCYFIITLWKTKKPAEKWLKVQFSLGKQQQHPANVQPGHYNNERISVVLGVSVHFFFPMTQGRTY